MDNGTAVMEKARQTSVSLYPKHDALIYAIQMHRASLNPNERIVAKVSEIFQEALVDLARRELGYERFEELMRGAA